MSISVMAPAKKTGAKGKEKKEKKGGKTGKKNGAVKSTASLHPHQYQPQSEVYVQEGPYNRGR